MDQINREECKSQKNMIWDTDASWDIVSADRPHRGCVYFGHKSSNL